MVSAVVLVGLWTSSELSAILSLSTTEREVRRRRLIRSKNRFMRTENYGAHKRLKYFLSLECERDVIAII